MFYLSVALVRVGAFGGVAFWEGRGGFPEVVLGEW